MPSSYVKMLTRSLVLFLCLSLAPAAPVKRNTSAEEGTYYCVNDAPFARLVNLLYAVLVLNSGHSLFVTV